jgi:hypothetical protein
MTLKSSVKQNHGLEKRVHEWSLKNSKMATLLAILWFIKLQSLIDSNTVLGFQNQSILQNRCILPKL